MSTSNNTNFFDNAKNIISTSVNAGLKTMYDEEHMLNSYNYMTEQFYRFGQSVKNASDYCKSNIQKNSSSAIFSDVIGKSLLKIWTENADEDFTGFINNFNQWGDLMVQRNNLSQDFIDEVKNTYTEAEASFLSGIGGAISLSMEIGAAIMADQERKNKAADNFGHTYVDEATIATYRCMNNVNTTVYSYEAADNFQERTKGMTKTEYLAELDKLPDAAKTIVVSRDCDKAKYLLETYGLNNSSSALFHEIDNLSPGQMIMYESLIESEKNKNNVVAEV